MNRSVHDEGEVLNVQTDGLSEHDPDGMSCAETQRCMCRNTILTVIVCKVPTVSF